MGRLKMMLKTRANALSYGVFLGKSLNFKLPDSIRFDGHRCQLKLPNEQGVNVAFRELLFADGYRFRVLPPRSIRTVLDIGSNVGLALLAERRAFPDAVIHGYEPNPNLEPFLKNQADIARASYYMEAMALNDGHVSLNFHADSVQTSSHVDEHGNIPAVALKTAVARIGGSVDIAKVDCEGAEWDLFKDKESWQKIDRIAMEYHLVDGREHDDAPDALKSLGYRIIDQDRASNFGLIFAARQSSV